MYKLNNIPLSNYGIYPGQAPLSNLALSGFLDMPERLGKTFHDWLDDEGLEPYVEADELFFGSRTITFHGLIAGTSQQDAVLKLREVYEDFGRLTDLIALSTPWGDFQVYLKDKIQARYMGNGWATLQMVFEQPLVAIPDEALPGERTIEQYHIDNIPFTAFGAFIEQTEGQYDRPELKAANFTSYNEAGYQLTKIGQSEVALRLWFHAADMATLQANVGAFHKLLASPGTRVINVDDTERDGFVVGGFKVNEIRSLSGQTICQLNVTLLLAFGGTPVVHDYLLNEQKQGIMDELGRFIILDRPAQVELLDEGGYNILNEQGEKIILG